MKELQAVMTGLNTYPDSPLQGCVNDVLVTGQILREKHGVPPQQIRTITDSRATRYEILTRLEWLIDQSSNVKNLLFWYSGHGAQYPDQKYQGDESDGMDEILCPIDFNWNGTWISDDDIFNIIRHKHKDCRLVMVFDACHSGTVFRNWANPRHTTDMDVTIKSIPTPLDLEARASEFDARDVIRPSDPALGDFWDLSWYDRPNEFSLPKVKVSKLSGLENMVIVSGCQDHQTSADARFGNRYQGALSYCLQRYMYSNPEFSVTEMENATIQYLKSFGFVQDPMFTVCANTDTSKFIMA